MYIPTDMRTSNTMLIDKTFFLDKLRIKAMFPGQPAENSEKLRVGDIIMAANGVSLLGKTSRDAINVLRDQPARVVLTVKRDPSSIPPGLLRRGSFSQSLDPNEVLSAIHSKLDHSTCPDDAESPTHKIRDSYEIGDSHASTSRKNSNEKGDNCRMLLGNRELPQDSSRSSTNDETSLVKSRIIMDGSEQIHRDDGGIMNNDIRSSQDDRDIYGLDDTSLDMHGINRSNSEQRDNDLPLKASTRNSCNNENISPDNYHRTFDPQAETADMPGNSALFASDEKDVVSGSKFLDRFTTGNLSSDEIVDGNRLQDNLESRPLDSTPVSEQIASPLESEALTSQTGGSVGEERDRARNKRNSSGRSLQNDKVEQLAPPEEVILKLQIFNFLYVTVDTLRLSFTPNS